ncbi:MAG: hypothetical protein Q9M50_00045 [Methylococcales bacterium]|nr:hypothetical protein [Methylococcales bacterium]
MYFTKYVNVIFYEKAVGETGAGAVGFEHPDCGHTEKTVNASLAATQTVVK